MTGDPKGKMKVQEVDVAGERRRKRLLVGGLLTASAVVLATGGFLSWYLTPPAMPQTAEEAMVVMKSARFKRLSAEQKRPYYDVVREQFGMDRELRQVWRADEDLRDAARDMFRQQMDERLDAFMLAGFEERQEMGMPWGGRPRGEGNRPEGGRPEGGPDPGAMRERMSDRMANGSAQRGAAMGEMIRQRRENGGGGGGGGGGPRGGGG